MSGRCAASQASGQASVTECVLQHEPGPLLNLASAEEALRLCAEIFPDEEVPERARLVLEDAFGD